MAKSSEVFTVFYSWQSDTPPRHARELIRNALNDAADALNNDDAIPYLVAIDQDTQGLTGLCDIPATILAKIAGAGAVVSDLTYIAERRRKGDPKRCSNPNVLFELGYAFHSVGPERLICVMNEAHGPRSGQIFDLNHRRHPIAFTSPAEGVTVAETRAQLAYSLTEALRPIVLKGPRLHSAENDNRHEAERSRIVAYAREKRGPDRPATATGIYVHPVRYSERRWPDSSSLRSLMWSRAIHASRHEYPPQQTGTAPMSWGLVNTVYGDAWAVTYQGQFWTSCNLAREYEGPPVRDRQRFDLADPHLGKNLPAGDWIGFPGSIREVFNAYRFAGSFAQEFADAERLAVGAAGDGFAGKWMAPTSARLGSEPWGPCESSGFERRWEMTASELQDGWRELAVLTCVEMCDLFCRDYRQIKRETIEGWIERFGKSQDDW